MLLGEDLVAIVNPLARKEAISDVVASFIRLIQEDTFELYVASFAVTIPRFSEVSIANINWCGSRAFFFAFPPSKSRCRHYQIKKRRT